MDRMRGGDREAAGQFLKDYGSRIRRRIHGKLSSAMRSIFDSQDILSTVGRKLDLYVRDGRFVAASPQQLWALITRMADCAVLTKARVFGRLREVEQEDSPFAHELLRRFEEAERARHEGAEIEIDRALKLLQDRRDRQVLSMWLMGSTLNDIAISLDMTPAAVRKRWQNIKSILHREFAPGLQR